MQLSKPDYRVRTIVPFPEQDPNFSIEMRRLPESELNRIAERVRYNPRTASPTIDTKYNKEVLLASVVKVNGATGDHGEALDPQADETRLLLWDAEVEVDGRFRSLWIYANELFVEQERAEAKNSRSA
jgi:hypothetical protein